MRRRWGSDQDVCPDQPEKNDHDLPDGEIGLWRSGDLGEDRVSGCAARCAGITGGDAAVRDERLVRNDPVPGADAAAAAAATAAIRLHATARDAGAAADDTDTAASDAAGGVTHVPADSSAPERQQPGVRPAVPAAGRGEPSSTFF